MNINALQSFQERAEELSRKEIIFRERFPDLPVPPLKFIEAIENERVRLCQQGVHMRRYGIPLLCLTSRKHAECAFETILSNVLFGPVQIQGLAWKIAGKCKEQRKWDLDQKDDTPENVEKLLEPKYSRPKQEIKNHRPYFEPENWGEDHRDAYLGAYLLYLFQKNTKLVNIVPKKPKDGKGRYTHFVHGDGVCKLFLGHKDNRLEAQPRLPMVIKPKIWETQSAGGYLSTPDSPLIAKKYDKKELPREKKLGERFLKAINALQDTKWSISPPLFEAMRLCIEDKTSLSAFDEANTELGIPEKTQKEEKEEIESVVKCLKLIEEFPKDSFYFPFFCDRRGRVYPRTTVVSPQESDPARSSLQFATGKELGESGMKWLKIHLSTQYGESGSFKTRLEWVEKNQSQIKRSASSPLSPENLRFWRKAKKKWAFLRSCIEFRDALESENISAFKSRLPIGVDGTCNGMQHIAALTRDKELARLTNLINGDSPRDFYQVIADRLRSILEPALLEEIEAKIKIDRNFTKTVTLALPYGIGIPGIKKNLQQSLSQGGINLSEESYDVFSRKFKRAINRQLGKNVTDFFKWIKVIAEDLAKATENYHLEWVTPTGFPIVEGTYRKKYKNPRIELQMEDGDSFPTFTIKELWEPNKFAVTLQGTNVRSCLIHSLDASHMASTVSTMHEIHGCRHFSMIHDDFRVCAADLETLNYVLRDEFCKLHKPNLRQDLVDQLNNNFPDVDLSPPPDLGSFDIEEVKKSTYFFS